jgi:hypothetical protein
MSGLNSPAWVGHVDLGQQGSRRRIERIGDPRDLAGERMIGDFRHADDRLNARRDADRS